MRLAIEHKRLRKSLTSMSERRRGAVAVLSAVLMTVVLGFVALSVDVGYIATARSRLQATSDAAALAAGLSLGSTSATTTDLVNSAREIALLNYYGSANQPSGAQIMSNSDLTIGTWNPTTRTFTPGGTVASANAVRVVTHQSTSTGNALKLFFAPAIGKSTQDIASTAIVYKKTATVPTDCYNNGVICGGDLDIDECDLDNVSCYGRNRVNCGSNCNFRNGSKCGSQDSSRVSTSGCSSATSNTLCCDKQPAFSQSCASKISDIESGVGLPSKITNVRTCYSWPPYGGVQPNTAYVVQNNCYISKNTTCNFKNNIIACKGSIYCDEQCTFNNTGSSSSGDCNTLFIAKYDVTLCKQSKLCNIECVAGDDLFIEEPTLTSTVGYCQSGGNCRLKGKIKLSCSPNKGVYETNTSKNKLVLVQ